MSLLESEKRQLIINRIGRLTPGSPAVWGRMTVNQMICHVTDQLRLALGEKGPPERKANWAERTLLKFLVLNVLPIPKNVPTSPKVDQMKEGTPPTEFETDRRTLLEYIEKFTARPADFAWTPHFRFGPLTAKEWAVLSYKHLNHHLKQFGV
jgi:hypothetical protein